MAKKGSATKPVVKPAIAASGRSSALFDTCFLKKIGSFYYHCDWHASHYSISQVDTHG
jgi:hypothetical protein